MDLVPSEIEYQIDERITSKNREKRIAEFHSLGAEDPLRALLPSPAQEPFAILHSFAEEVS